MPLSRDQLAEVVRRVRVTLAARKIIGVIGWRKNYHTAFTRGISDKKIRFFYCERPPKVKNIGPSFGFMLITQGVGRHKHSELAKSRIACSSFLRHKEVLLILKLCEDLLAVHPVDNVPIIHNSRRTGRLPLQKSGDLVLSGVRLA